MNENRFQGSDCGNRDGRSLRAGILFHHTQRPMDTPRHVRRPGMQGPSLYYCRLTFIYHAQVVVKQIIVTGRPQDPAVKQKFQEVFLVLLCGAYS